MPLSCTNAGFLKLEQSEPMSAGVRAVAPWDRMLSPSLGKRIARPHRDADYASCTAPALLRASMAFTLPAKALANECFPTVPASMVGRNW
jgi:hypothetical protein